ncbi:MAG TPA: hypothetical protein DHN33_02580 [Eubacteriaceae bacterium]|nr:hypothetical protein [Eubacteriaceae bacterium]
MTITALANTGFFLSGSRKNVLIDALHNKRIPPFYSVADDQLNAMIKGEGAYQKVDLLLFTHEHRDHFDGDLVCRFLQQHPETSLFATPHVLDALRQSRLYEKSFEARLHTKILSLHETAYLSVGGVDFFATSLSHAGESFEDVVNYAYTVTVDEAFVFHCGDAAPNRENYEHSGIDQLDITDALLDFPYVTLRSGRMVVSKWIQPKRIFLMHLPTPQEDQYQWRKAIDKALQDHQQDLPSVIIPEE